MPELGFDFFADSRRTKKFRVRTTLFGAGAGPLEQQAGSSPPPMRLWFCLPRHKIACLRAPPAGGSLLRGCCSIACAPVADGIGAIRWFTAWQASRK